MKGQGGAWRRRDDDRTDSSVFNQEQLGRIVIGVFGLDVTQSYAVLSRLKHMQQLNFPMRKVRRGLRTAYSIGEVMKTVVAFALLEAGMPSVRACDLILAAWDEILPAIRICVGSKARRRLVVEPHALSSVGRLGLAAQSAVERASVDAGPGTGVAGTRADGDRLFSATSVVVDLAALSRRAVDVVSEVSTLEVEAVRIIVGGQAIDGVGVD